MSRRREGPSAEAKIRVMKRDRFQCVYCGEPGTDVELEIDHIIPVSKGGSNNFSNLVTACRKCNRAKSDGEAPVKPSSKNERQGVNGLYVHTFNDDGKVHWQGQIIGQEEDLVLIQLFSWLDGRPTKVKPMPKEDLWDDTKCTVYSDMDEMKDAGEGLFNRLLC